MRGKGGGRGREQGREKKKGRERKRKKERERERPEQQALPPPPRPKRQPPSSPCHAPQAESPCRAPPEGRHLGPHASASTPREQASKRERSRERERAVYTHRARERAREEETSTTGASSSSSSSLHEPGALFLFAKGEPPPFLPRPARGGGGSTGGGVKSPSTRASCASRHTRPRVRRVTCPRHDEARRGTTASMLYAERAGAREACMRRRFDHIPLHPHTLFACQERVALLSELPDV